MNRLAALLAPWVLRRLDPSWALRLLREGARLLAAADEGALAEALLRATLADLAPYARRAGWRVEREEG